MKAYLMTFLFSLCLAACGSNTGTADGSTDLTPGDTQCRAPDYLVNAGEACDAVLKDCGNALCAPSLVCVDSICVSTTDAGTNAND